MTQTNPALVMIRQWLAENERSQAWLAKQIDVPERTLNRIITGESPLTPELCVTLEFRLDMNAFMLWRKQSDWLIMQEFNRQRTKLQEEREAARMARVYKPVETVQTDQI